MTTSLFVQARCSVCRMNSRDQESCLGGASVGGAETLVSVAFVREGLSLRRNRFTNIAVIPPADVVPATAQAAAPKQAGHMFVSCHHASRTNLDLANRQVCCCPPARKILRRCSPGSSRMLHNH